MKKLGFIIATLFALLLPQILHAQQKQRVAVLPSVGKMEPERLNLLTDKVREIASKTLPTNNFVLLRQDAIIEMIGNEDYFIACKEGTCIGELAKKANANYGARCDVFKVDKDLVLKFELYSVKDEAILETFTDYDVKDFRGMLAALEERLPAAFRKMLSSGSKTVSPAIKGGIGNIETVSGRMLEIERSYLVNLNTEPQGAILSFNGAPIGNCSKTPCKVELPEDNMRIVAALEQYETADTMVFIKQNNQNINIKLKSNFGVLEIKPAYKDGIGNDRQWNLTINGVVFSSIDNKLSPGNYEAKLSHECYEDISFDVGINKGKREIFDMLNYVQPKQGFLTLSAEKDGEPVSEPVFANGKLIGETPFSGMVPVCAKIGIGENKEMVDVELKNREKVAYKHIIKIDSNYTHKKFIELKKINFGIGGMVNFMSLDNKIYKDAINEPDSTKINMGFSIGLITGFSFTDWIALYSEFYYTYRRFENEQCSQNCTEIVEHAFDIPLLIKWKFLLEYGHLNLFYIETGILYSIPLNTKIYTSSTSIDREKYDFGYILGMGLNSANARYATSGDVGIRFGIITSDFTKNNKGSYWQIGAIARIGLL